MGISMCKGEECDRRQRCHRFTAMPNEFMQSFSERDPFTCEDFWDNVGYKKTSPMRFFPAIPVYE